MSNRQRPPLGGCCFFLPQRKLAQVNRRTFLVTVISGATVGTLAGCGLVDPLPTAERTFLSALEEDHDVETCDRKLDGVPTTYALSVDGVLEQPEASQYWQFYVDDVPIEGPIDEVMVNEGQVVSARLTSRPE